MYSLMMLMYLSLPKMIKEWQIQSEDYDSDCYALLVLV